MHLHSNFISSHRDLKGSSKLIRNRDLDSGGPSTGRARFWRLRRSRGGGRRFEIRFRVEQTVMAAKLSMVNRIAVDSRGGCLIRPGLLGAARRASALYDDKADSSHN